MPSLVAWFSWCEAGERAGSSAHKIFPGLADQILPKASVREFVGQTISFLLVMRRAAVSMLSVQGGTTASPSTNGLGSRTSRPSLLTGLQTASD